MNTIERVSPAEARQRVQAGTALLVCAYDDRHKFERNRLDVAIGLDELNARLDALSRHGELIFYCG